MVRIHTARTTSTASFSGKILRPANRSLLFALLVLFILPASSLTSQSLIRRSTFGSSGGRTGTEAGTSTLHGTLSQTVIGRAGNAIPGGGIHEAGFWRQGLLPNSETIVLLPETEAYIAHTLRIPVELTSVTGSLAGSTRRFTMRIRYNATLLEPSGTTPQPLRTGDTSYLELSGTALLSPGVLAELEFVAKLGNDTTTPLTIEEFQWETTGEERNRVITSDGMFRLLGVCREGDSVRLIHAAPSSARLLIRPNPAEERSIVQFTPTESGPTEMILYDLMGKEITHLRTFDAEAEQLYQIELDLQTIPGGAYTLLCRTPSRIITERLMIIE